MRKESNQVKTCTTQIGGQELCLSTGELAKQAGGSVLVEYGETVVLGTANMRKPMSPDASFMPLLVDYEEKFYAAGKIKGSRYIKREGRPTDDAILNARLIDRAIRPLFPADTINDIQVVITVLSYDNENNPDVPAMIAACAALMLSDIPWQGPLAGVRIGQVDHNFVVNPTTEEMETSNLDLFVAGTANHITMIEAGAHEVPENIILDALDEARRALAKVNSVLEKLQQKAGQEKKEPILMKKADPALITRIQNLGRETLVKGLKQAWDKTTIGQAENDTFNKVMEQLSNTEKDQLSEQEIHQAIHNLHATYFRQQILANNWRADERKLDQVRDLYLRVGLLPRTHGSGLFQRGQTQILTTVTLGGPSDMLLLDTMEIEDKKRYIHYYNFPAFSVGENRPNRGPGRREIGHGALAERALLPVLPPLDKWPYTTLLVSEVLESHGSSSMASVCGSSLALMDAGVPITKPVAGLAMGLVTEQDEHGTIGQFKILTDIAGIEDEKGDMDFKVAGTKDGITALQMDIKVAGLTRVILSSALKQAKKARLEILAAMNAVIDQPRPELSPYAPRIELIRIPVDKIGDLIGPKGKHINAIIEETGVEIDISDDGLVSITSTESDAMKKAKEWVHNMTREIQVGERFEGKVTKIMDFGAFVELVPGVEGMVHISQFRDEHVAKISDVVKIGEIIPVVVIEIDQMGRINLSHKAALTDYKVSLNNQKTTTSQHHRSPQSFHGPRPPRL